MIVGWAGLELLEMAEMGTPKTADLRDGLKSIINSNWRTVVGGGYIAKPGLVNRDSIDDWSRAERPCLLFKKPAGIPTSLPGSILAEDILIPVEISIAQGGNTYDLYNYFLEVVYIIDNIAPTPHDRHWIAGQYQYLGTDQRRNWKSAEFHIGIMNYEVIA